MKFFAILRIVSEKNSACLSGEADLSSSSLCQSNCLIDSWRLAELARWKCQTCRLKGGGIGHFRSILTLFIWWEQFGWIDGETSLEITRLGWFKATRSIQCLVRDVILVGWCTLWESAWEAKSWWIAMPCVSVVSSSYHSECLALKSPVSITKCGFSRLIQLRRLSKAWMYWAKSSVDWLGLR